MGFAETIVGYDVIDLRLLYESGRVQICKI